ncbi:MAG: hypothetical protein ACKO8Z_01275 [Prosthecobacter sp.]
MAKAVRHGECRNVCIKIEGDLDRFILTVADDGKGFPMHTRLSVGMGHKTMLYRARIKEKLQLRSAAELYLRAGQWVRDHGAKTWIGLHFKIFE